MDDLDDHDWRKTSPRFMGETFDRNLDIADEVQAIPAEAGATPAQVAIAWLPTKGDDIAPIPGTKRVSRLEGNVAADGIELVHFRRNERRAIKSLVTVGDVGSHD
jgi:aryl-alcohol dehydrogenase-like predicted oxidoreductase